MYILIFIICFINFINKFNYFIADEAKIEKDSKKTETKDENVTNTISQNEVQNIEDNVVTDTSKTELNKNSDTKKLQIIGVQNILYLNATSSDVKNDYKKAEGKVKTVFEIQEGKLALVDVIVEK